MFQEGIPVKDVTAYQRLIGRLIYLTNTRPDISYCVQFLSQFLRAPTSKHHNVAHWLLRYIKGTPGQGLFFPADSDLQLKGFCDLDWASFPQTRRSFFFVFLGSSLISWKSKKQSTMSQSSSEAEYRALATLTCEIQWLKYLINEFKIKIQTPTIVYCDNQSAMYSSQSKLPWKNKAYRNRLPCCTWKTTIQILSAVANLLQSSNNWCSHKTTWTWWFYLCNFQAWVDKHLLLSLGGY